MPTQLPASFLQSPFTDRMGLLTRTAANFLERTLLAGIQATSSVIASIGLTLQAASIGAVALFAVETTALYRVSWQFRITTAGGVSSALQLTITATDNGQPTAQSSANYVGNAVNAPQSGVFIVRASAGSPISYATTYASVGVPAMVYALDVHVERLRSE